MFSLIFSVHFNILTNILVILHFDQKKTLYKWPRGGICKNGSVCLWHLPSMEILMSIEEILGNFNVNVQFHALKRHQKQ